MFLKKIWPQEVVCLYPVAIHMYMTIIFKHLLHRNGMINQSQFHVEPSWEGETRVYTNGPGHMLLLLC